MHPQWNYNLRKKDDGKYLKNLILIMIVYIPIIILIWMHNLFYTNDFKIKSFWVLFSYKKIDLLNL